MTTERVRADRGAALGHIDRQPAVGARAASADAGIEHGGERVERGHVGRECAERGHSARGRGRGRGHGQPERTGHEHAECQHGTWQTASEWAGAVRGRGAGERGAGERGTCEHCERQHRGERDGALRDRGAGGRGTREHLSEPAGAHRDRGIDALRVVAILGVVLGHWLVTALVVDGGPVHVASPLRAIPGLAPASWLFQTLALFFFVGGLVTARSGRVDAVRRSCGHVAVRGGDGYGSRVGAARNDRGLVSTGAAGRGKSLSGHRTWLAGRLERLFRPVLVLVAVWSGLLIVATLWQYTSGWSTGVDEFMAAVRSRTVLKLVASPLWFLLVYAALTVMKPLVGRLHPAWPLAVVVVVDLGRFAFGAPGWIGWINLGAGWLVPFCLGAAWARGWFRSVGAAWGMFVGGVVATVVLTRWLGYPVSMVGVPGQGISNLNPPTLAAVTFGVGQCGLALLVLPGLRRVMEWARAWRAVGLVNRSAMTIFLWHQTALLTVSLVVPGVMVGLQTVPTDGSWLLARMLWVPVFAVVLAGLWAVFRRFERSRGAGRAKEVGQLEVVDVPGGSP
ncbi:acyltransferase [Dactylosporangium sp. NPDC051541]|uniref:acyltransferase n=1 Tax=Dactylosporangium sp. NPDC051541 TaxID=3363977 RepID=UPI00379B480E